MPSPTPAFQGISGLHQSVTLLSPAASSLPLPRRDLLGHQLLHYGDLGDSGSIIRLLLKEVFRYVGLDWATHVHLGLRNLRPSAVDLPIGNASKLKVDASVKLLKAHTEVRIKGSRFSRAGVTIFTGIATICSIRR
jgi:hypothetical protein